MAEMLEKAAAALREAGVGDEHPNASGGTRGREGGRFAPTRRAALLLTGAGALGACASSGSGPSRTAPALGAFRHGVASGDPLTDRVIIWTRVTPPDGHDGSAIPVAWRMTDAQTGAIVARGDAMAEAVRDHTVKVDVAGLTPGTAYAYAFETASARSPEGRTKTLPVGRTDAFSIATVSCSNHPAGYFHAYGVLAARPDVDLVLHLGDYIYEYGEGGYASAWGEGRGRVPEPPTEILTLSDYRTRLAQYRTDVDLQAAHAAHPWVVAWDDHETANNAYADGAENHDEATEGPWSTRRAAAVRAYMEWMPIREPQAGRAREAIWRSFEIGDLATLVMLETRLTARSKQFTLQDSGVDVDADPDDPEAQAAYAQFLSERVGDPSRSMIGAAQLEFVRAQFAASRAADKPWQVLGNQATMAPVVGPNYSRILSWWLKFLIARRFNEAIDPIKRSRFGLPQSLDGWDGYSAERARLYAACREAGARLITLTGDAHSYWANQLEDAAGPVGAELVTSSVSSPSANDLVPSRADWSAELKAVNPHIRAVDVSTRGFTVLRLNRTAAQAEWVGVSTVEAEDFDVVSRGRFALTPLADGGTQIAAL